MTIEEKAKAYDEALERAKEIKSKILSSHLSTESCKAVSEYIDEIIPELTESEDDRTKRMLNTITYKMSQHQPDIFTEEENEWFNAYLEKQKEQKPVDDKAFEEWLDDWYQGSKEAGGDVVMSESEFKNWSRGIRNMYEQKPAEWSEEDEKMLDEIIRDVMTLHNAKNLDELKDKIDFLKSLRPQPKQKRQIKEGDKVSIHCQKDRKEDIISFYDGKVGEVIHVWNAKKHPWGHIIVKLDNGCNDGFYEDEIEVLDELSWKPSEHQMTILKAVKNYVGVGSGYWGEALGSLIEDLEKL